MAKQIDIEIKESEPELKADRQGKNKNPNLSTHARKYFVFLGIDRFLGNKDRLFLLTGFI